MADVKWIKITTDMFDNRKIKHLRRLPDGNNIVLIWVMLLTMAGRCNASGLIFLTENIPYTPKMLADELGFEENTVQLALKALEQFSMIVMDNGYFAIAGWEEHQNVDGMERIKEQNRIRKQNQRERQKLIEGVSRDSHVTVTQCHATDKEKEGEEDHRYKEKKETAKKPPKETNTTLFERLYPEYILSDALIAKMREWMIYKSERKDEYTEQGMKSLLRRIENTYLERKKQDKEICDLVDECMGNNWKGIIFEKLKPPIEEKADSFDTDDFFKAALSRSMGGEKNAGNDKK